MASIQKRGKKYCVIYRIYDDEGKAQQKWETYDTEAAAKKRKLEVEYKLSVGTFEVPKCVTVKELLDEYVNLYGSGAFRPMTGISVRSITILSLR